MRDGGDSKPLPLFLLIITPLSAFENKQSAFQFLRQPSFTLLKPSDSSPNKPTGETNKISHRDLRPSCPRSPVPPAAPARRGQALPRAPPPATHPRSSRVPHPSRTCRCLASQTQSCTKPNVSQTRPLTPVRGDDKGCSAPASSLSRMGRLVSSPGADRRPRAVL